MRQLSQGQVVEVLITDPCGRNEKARPAVLLTATHDIPDADQVVVVAISTQLADPLPPDWIELPWSPDGRAKSGLTERCVAKCHWLRKVTREQIVSIRGWLPATVVRDIIEIVAKS